MDFNEAIKAHSAWKMKLSAYLAKPDGSLKAADVEKDNVCELGKWLHGEGTKHNSVAEYAPLVKDHATFHKCAAEVIRKADAGQNMSEEVALGSSSAFATASSNVVGAIMKMKAKLA